MEFANTMKDMFVFQSLRYVGVDESFLNPIFLRVISCFIHLGLFFVILGLCVWRMIRRGENNNNVGNKLSTRNVRFMYYKPTLFCSIGLVIFSFMLCLLTHFYWYRTGWSEEEIVTLLDFASKFLAWLLICVFLKTQLVNSGENKYPLVLRVCWGILLFVSCYCLVIDVVYGKKTQFWVPDCVFTVMGLLFCVVGFIGKKESEGNVLEEPLLNGSVVNGIDLKRSSGDQTVTPYANANIFSLFTFSWMGPLISVGYKKTLDLEDVPQLHSNDSVRGSFPIFRDKLESVGGGDGSSNRVTTLMLAKALVYTAWKEIVLSAFLVLLYTLASYVGPYLIDTLVQYLNGKRDFDNEGYVLVATFFIAKLVESLAQRHWFFKVQQGGYRARAALVAKLYNKGLTLSCQSKQSHTSGEIINFMTVDAERIGDFGWYMHDTWMVVIQVGLALLILYKNLGLAAIAAFVATVIVMLLNIPLGGLQEKFQEKLMDSKDRRMKATSEVLRNMRILKLQAWEMKFLSRIMDLRSTEAGWLKKYVYTSAMTTFVFWVSPTFVSVTAFGAAMLMGIPLESGKILSALATFRILQEPIYSLPDTISMIAQTKVSLDRIASFLSLEDLQHDVIEKLPKGSSDVAVEIIDGNFAWDVSSSIPLLKDVNIRVLNGMRVAVCGTVGSGKSSLLSSILGEMPKLSGSIKISGTKAYVAQSPWIQSGKIEENILFGKEMQREKYDEVLEACSLKKDLEILSFGDQTVIGERGINLSGGQKQRIQIARALYQDADVYLFDDPFSAVDAHTGTHLFSVSHFTCFSFTLDAFYLALD